LAAYYDVFLPEIAHEIAAQLRPPCPLDFFRHDLDDDDLIVLGFAAIFPAAFAR
jgi:hypothetical protein